MYDTQHEFLAGIAPLVGWFHFAACAVNLGAAVLAWRKKHRQHVYGVAWLAVAAMFGVLGWRALGGHPVGLPPSLKAAIDSILGPVTFTLGWFAALVVFYLGRRLFAIPAVAWAGLNASLVFLGLSLTDPEFAAVVSKPDNLPILAMVLLLGFFTWWATAQAVRNDDRIRQSLKPVETDYSGTVLAWPDVVYSELIGVVIATTVLVVWSLLVRAPLEQPANPAVTPNPSKAPWYFLGLQEMLVYFPPWIAGVTIPCLIILGLMAIPYLDFNPKGKGYYTITERRFSYLAFQFGFLQLWIMLILIGTFMRGPNWSFFGLYEPRDLRKVLAMTNVSLSEYFWVITLGRSLPEVPIGRGALLELGCIIWRESPGIAALAIYFLGLPILLGHTVLRQFRRQMGLARYTIMALLLLMMLALPLKMILNWTLHLNYVVSIPEYFLYF